MIYRLANPSDPYTLETDSFKVACAASFLLGSGHYPLDPVEQGGESLPFLLTFDDAIEWVGNRFVCTFDELVDSVDRTLLAECLESVLIGDRNLYEAAIKHIPPSERATFHQEWHEKNRSSLNDIGHRAWGMAKTIRKNL